MKIFYLFIVTVVAVALSSCNSGGAANGKNKMTSVEEQRLVDLARSFILRSKKIATPAERLFIKNNYPTVSAVYDGYKTGKTTILWDTGKRKRKLVARLYGSMTGENHKWRISVYFDEEIIYTPRSKVRDTPIQQGSVKDFSDMFRKQAVNPEKRTAPVKK
jgi:hypothetical protein